jgi:hypothetical protein
MIHRHWCKVCGARLEVGDNGYCAGACTEKARDATIDVFARCDKEALLRTIDRTKVPHEKKLAALRARVIAHPWDDASAFAAEFAEIVRPRAPAVRTESGTSADIDRAIYEALRHAWHGRMIRRGPARWEPVLDTTPHHIWWCYAPVTDRPREPTIEESLGLGREARRAAEGELDERIQRRT